MTYASVPATSTPAESFATDEVASKNYPIGKTALGTEGTVTEWHAANGAAANGARVAMSTEDRALLGLTDATAAADETANTGLNGLLKGIFAKLRGTLTAQLAAGTNYAGQVGVEHSTSAIRDGSTSLTPKFAAISAASSGDNTVVALVANKKIRVLSYALVADGAVTAKFQSDATDLTGAMSFAANGGISTPFSPVGHFETAAGVALQINLGGAVGVRGHLTYVEV